MVTTVDRVLSILKLFTMEQPRWSVEEAASELEIKTSTAYRYFGSLASAGLIVAHGQGKYTIGPAIIEFDRQTRHLDPLIRAARADLEHLQVEAGKSAGALLCRLYGQRVMCVDQCMPETGPVSSYERGRPMPLFRGSASKVILAYLPWRALRRLYEEHQVDIAAAEMGDDWGAFRSSLGMIRRHGLSVTAGEVDAGLIGISSPVFSGGGGILASIGVVIQAADKGEVDLRRLEAAVRDAGASTSRRIDA